MTFNIVFEYQHGRSSLLNLSGSLKNLAFFQAYFHDKVCLLSQVILRARHNLGMGQGILYVPPFVVYSNLEGHVNQIERHNGTNDNVQTASIVLSSYLLIIALLQNKYIEFQSFDSRANRKDTDGTVYMCNLRLTFVFGGMGILCDS